MHLSHLVEHTTSTTKVASPEVFYTIERRHVEKQLLAAVCRRSAQRDLPSVVPAACGEAFQLARQLQLCVGRNVAMYRCSAQDGLLDVDIGLEVFEPFESAHGLLCLFTPAGSVITTTHVGPYRRLGDAFAALNAWAAHNECVLEGTSWEVYECPRGNDEPPVTHVYCLVRVDGEVTS